MAISDSLAVVGNTLLNLFQGKATVRAIRKDELEGFIKDSIKLHDTVYYNLTVMDDNDMRKWVTDRFKVNGQTTPIAKLYEAYQRALQGKAQGDERDRMLGSLANANDKFSDILKEMYKNVDVFMEKETMDIFDTRITLLAVFGLLKQSEILANFSTYLYTYLIRSSIDKTMILPKYRLEFFKENTTKVAKIVSDIANKKGVYNFLNECKTIRRKGEDIVLSNGGNFDIRRFSTVAGFNSNFLDVLMTILHNLNPFTLTLDLWDEYQMNKYEKNKETKEWLEQHNALLRMDLNEMDKSSPEYKKTLQIIQAYDERITEYDQRIKEFEEAH